jgi:hypothetical protein
MSVPHSCRARTCRRGVPVARARAGGNEHHARCVGGNKATRGQCGALRVPGGWWPSPRRRGCGPPAAQPRTSRRLRDERSRRGAASQKREPRVPALARAAKACARATRRHALRYLDSSRSGSPSRYVSGAILSEPARATKRGAAFSPHCVCCATTTPAAGHAVRQPAPLATQRTAPRARGPCRARATRSACTHRRRVAREAAACVRNPAPHRTPWRAASGRSARANLLCSCSCAARCGAWRRCAAPRPSAARKTRQRRVRRPGHATQHADRHLPPCLRVLRRQLPAAGHTQARASHAAPPPPLPPPRRPPPRPPRTLARPRPDACRTSLFLLPLRSNNAAQSTHAHAPPPARYRPACHHHGRRSEERRRLFCFRKGKKMRARRSHQTPLWAGHFEGG